MLEIKPYIKDINSQFADSDMFIDFFNCLNTPFNYEQYVQMVNSYISKENFLSPEKKEFLDKIYNDMSFLHDLLNPLYKLGIRFQLELAGGAVRDFVLNRHHQIKDLDVMLTIKTKWFDSPEKDLPEFPRYRDLAEEITLENLLDVGFSIKEIESSNFIENDQSENPSLRLNQLIQLCLSKKNNKIKTFLNNRKNVTQFDNSERYGLVIGKDKSILTGVIKLNNSQLNYPMDILINKKSQYEFIDSFDFNFCKASFIFVNHEWKKVFPKSPEQLISRFYSSFSFFADIFNQKMTIEANKKNMASINKTVTRLPQIQKKYAEYQINIVNNPDYSDNNHKVILAHSILESKLLIHPNSYTTKIKI